jgi:hypothetical protein
MQNGDDYLRALENRLASDGMVSIARSYMGRVNRRHANQGDGQWAALAKSTTDRKAARNKAPEILQEDRLLIRASREGATGNLPPTVADGGVVTGFAQTPHPNFQKGKGTFAQLASLHATAPRLKGRVILAKPTEQEFQQFMKDMVFWLQLF